MSYAFNDDKSKVEVYSKKDDFIFKTINFSGSTIQAGGITVLSSVINGVYSKSEVELIGSVLINPHDYELAFIGCHVEEVNNTCRLYVGVKNIGSVAVSIPSSSDLKVTAQLRKLV